MDRKIKWISGAVVAAVLVVFLAVAMVLSRYDFNDLKPMISGSVMEATGRRLVMGGDIDLKIGLTPTLVMTDITFQNAEWGSRPDLTRIDRFVVQVELLPLLEGNIAIKQFSVEKLDLLIERNPQGVSNLAFEPPAEKGAFREEKKPSDRLVLVPPLAFDLLEIRDSRVTLKDSESGKTSVVALHRLKAGCKGLVHPVDLEIEGAFNQVPFSVGGTLGSPADLMDGEKAWRLHLEAGALDAVFTLDGAITDVLAVKGVDLDFKADVKHMERMMAMSGAPLPLDGPLALSGKVKAEGSSAYSVPEFRLSHAGNAVQGSASFDLTDRIPRLTAKLSAETLDLRPYMQRKDDRAKEDHSAGSSRERAKVFPDDPLPLDAVSLADLSAAIHIGRLLMPNLSADDVSLDVVLQQGRISVGPLGATIGGGSVNGQVDVKASGRTAAVSARLKAEGVGLGKMLEESEIADRVDGSLDMDVRLNGQGGSIAAIMAGLNGHTNLILDNGRFDNAHVELLGADISGSLFRMFNPLDEEKAYTEINCMVSRFDVKNGVADSTALVLDTPQMSVIGDGTIDLRTERLDMSLKPTPKKGIGGAGTLSFSLGELAKPFTLGGTLARPALALDPAQTALIIGKTVGAIALFGPAGIAAALAGGSADEQNPCVAAIEAARTGVKPIGSDKPEAKKGVVEKTTEGIGGALKKLFGN